MTKYHCQTVISNANGQLSVYRFLESKAPTSQRERYYVGMTEPYHEHQFNKQDPRSQQCSRKLLTLREAGAISGTCFAKEEIPPGFSTAFQLHPSHFFVVVANTKEGQKLAAKVLKKYDFECEMHDVIPCSSKDLFYW